MLCTYYQAVVVKKETWFLVSTLRSFEHLTFDRTLNKETGIFELFVPPKMSHFAEELLEYYKKHGVIVDYTMLPNRMLDSATDSI